MKFAKVPADTASGLKKYERETRNTIKENGEFDEKKLVKVFDRLIDNLENKMEGFSYKETVEHYRSILKTAWKMVREAKTPEMAMEEFTNGMEWMMLDEKFERKSSQIFSRSTIYPTPYWWWYMYPRYEEEPNIGGGPSLTVKS